MKIVILAGGLGIRMREKTISHQKCMLHVNSKPILQYVIDTIKIALGGTEIIIVTGHRYNQIIEYFGNEYGEHKITYLHSDDNLGERKRLLLAEHAVESEHFFVFLAGDVIYKPTLLTQMISLHMGSGSSALATLSGADDLSPAPSHGVIKSSKGIVKDYMHPVPNKLSGKWFREMGIGCASPRIFHYFHNAPPELTPVIYILNHAFKMHKELLLCIEYYNRWFHYAEPSDLQIIPSFI